MGFTLKYIQHHTSGRKSYRRQFPNDVDKSIGQTQIRVSLGRPDSPGFMSRYSEAAAEYDRVVAKARQRLAETFHQVTPALIEFLIKSLKAQYLDDDDGARWEPRSSERKRQARDQIRADCAEDLSEALELRALGDIDAIVAQWGGAAEEHADLWGFALDKSAPDFPPYVRAFHDAQIAVWQTILERFEGANIPTPPMPSAPTSGPQSAKGSPQAPAVPIIDTYDEYALARKLTIRVRKEWRASILRLVAHVGHDNAALLTASDLRGWRDVLKGETIRGGKPRSPVTIRNKYIRAVKAMLEWAVQEGRLESNAADKVVVDVPRRPKLRASDFTHAEAKAILAATLLPAPERLTEGHRLARRWVPWLCAYTGARVGEMAQLRAEDVKQVDGIWYCLVTPEAGSVKTAEAREVPLHAHLIEQGFLAMVQAKGSGPLFYDPARQRATTVGNRHIAKVGTRLAEWVRKEVGITDTGIKPNHAWRHTFKTIGAEAGLEDRVMDDIEGHSRGTVGGTYQRSTLRTMANAIARFPRFDVPAAPLCQT